MEPGLCHLKDSPSDLNVQPGLRSTGKRRKNHRLLQRARWQQHVKTGFQVREETNAVLSQEGKTGMRPQASAQKILRSQFGDTTQ